MPPCLLVWLDSELYMSNNIDLYISKCAVSFTPWLHSYLLSAFGFLHLIQLQRDCLRHSKLLSCSLTAAIETRIKTKLFCLPLRHGMGENRPIFLHVPTVSPLLSCWFGGCHLSCAAAHLWGGPKTESYFESKTRLVIFLQKDEDMPECWY